MLLQQQIGRESKSGIIRRKKIGADTRMKENRGTEHTPLFHGLSSVEQSPIYFSRIPLQAKLTVGQPNDKYEQEADRMAEQVMRIPENKTGTTSSGNDKIQRKCTACESSGTTCTTCAEEEEKLQMKPLASQVTPLVQRSSMALDEGEEMVQTKTESGVPAITRSFQSQLNASKGGGSPLPKFTNRFMSNAFGTDFSHVRIHNDSGAHKLNTDIRARAFTHGSDIYFNKGQYSPQSAEGIRLLVHELTHVVQQSYNFGGCSSQIRCAPSKTYQKTRHNKSLKRLIAFPDEALYEWRHLKNKKRHMVLEGMEKKYGTDFVNQFKKYASGKLKPDFLSQVLVDSLSQYPNLTREWFEKRGYYYAGYTPVSGTGRIFYWVRPSGREIRYVSIPFTSSPSSVKKTQPAQKPSIKQRENPSKIDLSAEPENIYGKEIAERQNAVIMGQMGYAIQYKDGTIELYIEGTSSLFTYRPHPDSSGSYDFYNEKGEKVDNVIIVIDPSEVFSSDSKSN